jgi:hypothetical protein
MTIGLIALRAAKLQLVAAIATIKDELKNPELAEQIKFEVYNLGSDFDDHLTELGNAMPRMFKEITLLDPTQENGIDAPVPSNIQDAEAAGSPSAEDLDRVAEEQKAAAATGAEHHHKGLGENIREILDGVGNAIGEAKFNVC